MPIRSLERRATALGYATPDDCPIYVKNTDNIARYIPAGSGTTEVQIVDASASQTLSNKTIASPVISGTITSYNGLPTAAFGVPTIVAQGRSLAQAAAVSSVCTFTPTADGSFLISMNILILAGSTSFSISGQVTYTDEGGTARTQTMMFTSSASATGTTLGNASGTLAYSSYPIRIRNKGGNAITILTSGTFTTISYNVEGDITQVA